MKILEISPYEPPASGWVNRIKLLRQVIEERGGTCEILDIGPSRKLVRPECISVMNGADYLAKTYRFSKLGFTFHCHINGEYFRGMILAIAALIVARTFRNRRITTFHAGTDQEFLDGWKYAATWPFYWVIFALSHATICNSEDVATTLTKYQPASKVVAIPAFSRQYLEFRVVSLKEELESFIRAHRFILTTYICPRPGFYIDVLVSAAARLVEAQPDIGLVIVGTGESLIGFCDSEAYRKLEPHLFLAGDLDHDTFLTLLTRTHISLRTPTTDGVSATVLESLSMSVPVVASDNGSRPNGVMTYQGNSPDNLLETLERCLSNLAEIAASIPRMEVADTASIEVDLLQG